jgi:hypothetical protein
MQRHTARGIAEKAERLLDRFLEMETARSPAKKAGQP